MSKHGVSLFGLKEVANEFGFECDGALVAYEDLLEEIQLPVIAHWRQSHFVVIYKVTAKKVYISDPAQGNKVYKKSEFLKLWASVHEDDISKGAILILNPTEAFYELKNETNPENGISFKVIFNYLRKHKTDFTFLFLAIGVSSILQFLFPFLTQLIVDSGISNKDVGFIQTILFAQLALLAGRLFIEYVRGWLLLYINTRININILSDFLIKLLRLPLSFFDTKMSGDILQRMSDQRRVQDFLSGPALEITFSLTTIVVLSITLLFYNLKIYLIFLISSALYIAWTLYLLKRRRILDYKRFELSAQNQNEIIQLISGIQEIKMNNSENQKRWSWEKIQSKLFTLNLSSLKYAQTQQSGSFLINEGKNILITYTAAMSVINGDFTLGMMLAIQAIVGQLNGPISVLISLVQNFQDTKLSLERLNEINKVNNEEPDDKIFVSEYPAGRNIVIENLSFRYPGLSDDVLKNVSITIPQGKTTAIVGASGSGKTTLLKLLLKFYDSYNGSIALGKIDFKDLSHVFWRSKCGTVLQDGFIFSDTIAGNISIGFEQIENSRLKYALKTANIEAFVAQLPLGSGTKIGSEGMGISQGQKQRILIARSIYKDPDFIFFDEATNALDANNEAIITRNLEDFFQHKTVVVVAHRLSTVRNADQIIVLDQGRVIESGSHNELVALKGAYFTLIRNQLELGA